MARYKTRGNQGTFSRNIPSPSLPLTTTQGGDAMDLSASQLQPRRSLTLEEKERRKNLGLCYSCGKEGHRAVNCRMKNSKDGSSLESRLEGLPCKLDISVSTVHGDMWKETSYLVINCYIKNKFSVNLKSLALIDSGASAHGFVDIEYAHKNNLNLVPLEFARKLQVFYGTESASGCVTHFAKTTLTIAGHIEKMYLLVTKLARFDIVLGLPWLRLHNPKIDWANDSILFENPQCAEHCLEFPTVIQAIQQNEIGKLKRSLMTKTNEELHALTYNDAESFVKSASKEILRIMAVSLEDIREALKEKPEIDPLERLPKIYHEFLSVFSKKDAERLPPHRPSDHQIILKPGSEPPWGPLYSMSKEEGFIKPSTSPASSPVLFVKKPGGGLRFCVDYRTLNDITVKNRYPIPRINETLNLLGKSKYFSKLDVISAFHRMRIAKGHEFLTAFRTRFGLYEYRVMPFGLANAPSSFQNHINDTLRGYLDEFCTAYMDDILIFSKTFEEHEEHVKKVLSRLSRSGLQIDIRKCEFHKKSAKFLGLIITAEGIKMDPSKLQAIEKWEIPKNVKDVFKSKSRQGQELEVEDKTGIKTRRKNKNKMVFDSIFYQEL
ncbi:hypothetical protein EPUL_003076 [Erysiphe pulchra]|uniref:CCHC-type domain-containing protein n=1 Tax=Erysiphe pulchra TaxID=225359 RepID=A0A2S4PMW0_9PEZI|nr:hypothetical protein EPUL_003076 [Erysiphe pulchra]